MYHILGRKAKKSILADTYTKAFLSVGLKGGKHFLLLSLLLSITDREIWQKGLSRRTAVTNATENACKTCQIQVKAQREDRPAANAAFRSLFVRTCAVCLCIQCHFEPFLIFFSYIYITNHGKSCRKTSTAAAILHELIIFGKY